MHNIGKITRYIYLCKLVFQSRVSNLLHRNLLQGRKSLFINNFIFRVTVYYELLDFLSQSKTPKIIFFANTLKRSRLTGQ